MKTLYFDCFSGISGDMTIGALINLGIDEFLFKEELKKLNLKGYRVEFSQSIKKGITGTKFDVLLDHPNHNHHGEHHHGHSHSHEHRNLTSINNIIDNSELNENVKRMSKGIFLYVAEAEAKVHGKDIEDIHFHEVGALDSIIDIVGTAICIDMLKVDRIISSPLNTGSGFVECQHGTIPVPAPATVEILAKHNGLTYSTGIKKELVTPTGAAIITYLTNEYGNLPEMKIDKVAYGAGTRDLEIPNMLRVYIGESKKKNKGVYVIETNIDDMTGETAGYVMEKLIEEGALDVFYTPVFMKKNRPAYMLSVICDMDKVKIYEDIIFRETTTIGIRKYIVERECLLREETKKDTEFGTMRMKKISFNGEDRVLPEYEECKRIARSYKVPLKDVYRRLNNENN